MAVPKKRVSSSRVKRKYNSNFSKSLKCRRLNYTFIELMQLVTKNEYWMPIDFIVNKKNKYQRKR